MNLEKIEKEIRWSIAHVARESEQNKTVVDNCQKRINKIFEHYKESVPAETLVIKADSQAMPNGGRMELEDQVWKKFAEGLCHEKTRDATFANMFKWIKEDYEKKIKWFMGLANVMQVEGYTDKAIMSIDVEAWTDYYCNKLTPEEALYEDNTNG